MMTKLICLFLIFSFFFGLVSGNLSEVSSALAQGAKNAVNLVLSIGGVLCFWSGLLEVMNESGLTDRIARLFSPLIRLLFGRYRRDEALCQSLSQNMAANLLGLGSAATPAGLKAAGRLSELCGSSSGDAVLRLLVLNTASIQLIPTNIAAVRAAAGAAEPFDILPAVWLASIASVAAALTAAKLFSKVWRP
ncbi:nucleoside recognition domain-containing protein [Acidaminobacterium chupaoyuni]